MGSAIKRETATRKNMPRQNNFKVFYSLSLAWQLGFLIAIPIGGFMFLGFWADKSLETSPLFTMTGLIVGLVVTVYEVYHLLAPLIKKDSDINEDDDSDTDKKNNTNNLSKK